MANNSKDKRERKKRNEFHPACNKTEVRFQNGSKMNLITPADCNPTIRLTVGEENSSAFKTLGKKNTFVVDGSKQHKSRILSSHIIGE